MAIFHRAGRKRIDGCDRRDEWVISCCAYPCLKVFWVGQDSGWSQDWFTEGRDHCHHIWKWAWKLQLPCVCSPSVVHHGMCVKLEKSRTKKKKTFFSLLFPAFCLTWWDVGLVSAKCWVRSVLVLCWHGCHVLPFCSDTLPTDHVCPLKFEISTVCIWFCISILSLCNLPCDHTQASAPAWGDWTDRRQECVFLLSLSSCALTEKLLSMLPLCWRCLGA